MAMPYTSKEKLAQKISECQKIAVFTLTSGNNQKIQVQLDFDKEENAYGARLEWPDKSGMCFGGARYYGEDTIHDLAEEIHSQLDGYFTIDEAEPAVCPCCGQTIK